MPKGAKKVPRGSQEDDKKVPRRCKKGAKEVQKGAKEGPRRCKKGAKEEPAPWLRHRRQSVAGRRLPSHMPHATIGDYNKVCA